MTRAPASFANFVRGKSGHVPFWPGGLEDAVISRGTGDISEEEKKQLRTVAPGLSRGLRLPGDPEEDETLQELEGIYASEDADISREVGVDCAPCREMLISWDQQAEAYNGHVEAEAPVAGSTEIDELLPTTVRKKE